MKRICVVTATRAEYGLLKNVIVRLEQETDIIVNVVVTGTHLSPRFGETYREIEKDGVRICAKIPILEDEDTALGVLDTMGNALKGFGGFFQSNPQDMLIILGDRYEIMAVCIAAMMEKIPIAHIHGGEITEGAIDDAIRHSITKMSYLHFASTEEYRKRILQLGEQPDRVFNVGALGVENVLRQPLMSREELEKSIAFVLGEQYGLVTFHPVTLEEQTAIEQLHQLLEAMNELEDYHFIITMSNADEGGIQINEELIKYAHAHEKRIYVTESLGVKRYLTAMKYASFVLGNSSSGIIEAPAMRVPSVNIGDRQKGRMQAESILNCEPVCREIVETVRKTQEAEFLTKVRKQKLPYGEGDTSKKIVDILKTQLQKGFDLKKKFYDVRF